MEYIKGKNFFTTLGLFFLFLLLALPDLAHAKPRSQVVGESWGSSCWGAVKKKYGEESFNKISNKEQCKDNLTCNDCCNRKSDRCRRKYPKRPEVCFDAIDYCRTQTKGQAAILGTSSRPRKGAPTKLAPPEQEKTSPPGALQTSPQPLKATP